MTVVRLENRWVSVSGLRLHMQVSARAEVGLPVILLHGLGVSGRYLLPTARLLAGNCQVFVPTCQASG